jgi:O-antigen ligase
MRLFNLKLDNLRLFTVLLIPLGLVSVAKFGPIKIHPYQIPLCLGMVILVISTIVSGRITLSKGCLIAIIFYFTAMIISIANAPYPSISIKQMILSINFAMIFVIISSVRSVPTIIAIQRVIIVGCVLLCFYELICIVGIALGFVQMIQIDRTGYHFYRPRGLFSEANEFGAYIVFVFGYAATEVFSRYKINPRWLITLLLIMAIPLLVLNMSRGSWIGCLAESTVILFLLNATKIRRIRFQFLLKILLGLLIFSYVSFQIVSKTVPVNYDVSVSKVIITRILGFLTNNDETVSIRFANNLEVLKSIEKHPLIGIGFGNAFAILNKEIPDNQTGRSLVPDVENLNLTTGNILTDIGGELGALGLIAFGSILICALYVGTKKLKHSGTYDLKVVRIGAIASCVGLFFNGISYATHMIPFFWISVAIACVSIVDEPLQYPQRMRI